MYKSNKNSIETDIRKIFKKYNFVTTIIYYRNGNIHLNFDRENLDIVQFLKLNNITFFEYVDILNYNIKNNKPFNIIISLYDNIVKQNYFQYDYVTSIIFCNCKVVNCETYLNNSSYFTYASELTVHIRC